MKRKAYSRVERETMIIQEFAKHIQDGGENEFTAYQIAKRLDVRASCHLYAILRGMVAAGKLDTYSRPNAGHWTTWFYALPKGSYIPPKKSHKIALKAKGVLVGQLELFS